MSSLWTPGGEVPIDRDQGEPAQPTAQAAPGEASFDDLPPEEQERARQMAQEMAAVQEQLASVPAAQVVANHAMGFYELAAIHLSQEPPNLVEASVAIDAMTAVVEKLAGRLGEPEATLKDALGQLRMAYVQISQAVSADEG